MTMDTWSYDEKPTEKKSGMLKWRVQHRPVETSSSGTESNASSDDLRYMMQDLQTGFTDAMSELTKIQDEDQSLHEKITSTKTEQDTQISSILEAVNGLKAQCECIQRQIDISDQNQRTLEDQLNRLKSDRKLDADRIAEPVQNKAGFSNPMMKPFIASLPLAHDGEDQETMSEESDSSLAEITQKNLVLTNALAQKAYSNKNSSQLESDDNSTHSSLEEGDTMQSQTDNKPIENPAKQHLLIKRESILNNLIDSERLYCTSLYILIDNYSKPLLSSGAVSHKECSKIFSPSLSRIYEHHCSILKSLERRLANWNRQDVIGDLFAKFSKNKRGDVMASYKEYIHNFTCALRTIKRLNKSSERFRTTLRKCQRESSGDKLSLVTQLLAPVRRVPSYIITIKKLLKYTEPDHPDAFFLESSLTTFRTALQSMNEAMETSIKLATSKHDNSSRRSMETSSYSSHEEDQRMSTATKDSGIHSHYGELEEELSSLANSNTINEKKIMKNSKERLAKKASAPAIRERPRSVLEVRSLEPHPVRRSKTPTAELLQQQTSHHTLKSTKENRLQKTGLYYSTPNLLDNNSTSDESSLKSRLKHTVQFKNPPEEPERLNRKHKKRSISDTLKIFFTKQRKGKPMFSSTDAPNEESTTSIEESIITSPPDMFANNENVDAAIVEELLNNGETLEDENGDPYSVV